MKSKGGGEMAMATRREVMVDNRAVLHLYQGAQ